VIISRLLFHYLNQRDQLIEQTIKILALTCDASAPASMSMNRLLSYPALAAIQTPTALYLQI